jgi:hypothetical protein
LTFDPLGLTFIADPTLPVELGDYIIALKASIPQPSHPLFVKSVAQSFLITVINDCFDT